MREINLSVLTGEHFIDGRWRAGGGQRMHPINPGPEQTAWSGTSAHAEQVDLAVTAAGAAFADWSQLALEQRVSVVKRFAEQLQQHRETLAHVIHIETGKPRWESLTEADAMVSKVGLSIQALHARSGAVSTVNGGVTSALQHRAQGVLAVLGPYNFPGHLPNGHIVPALLAGNCIVFKPSEFTPATAELMTRCWAAAKLPQGVLNLVQGSSQTGRALSAHDDIQGLLFTGSSHTGALLHQLFAGKPEKILALEMGGNNPLVVDHVSDLDAGVYTIIQSAFVSAGQRCTCARRLILIRSEQNEKILAQLVRSGKRLSVGFTESDFYGPVIHNEAAQDLLAAQLKLVDAGGHPLLTMARLNEQKPLLSPAIIDMTDAHTRYDEEYFGPLLQVIWVDDLKQAVREANRTRFGLSAGLLSDDEHSWQYFYPRVNAGIVNFNRPLTGASGAAPFGGVGASGNHRPSAYYAADYCAHPVASQLADRVSVPTTLAPGVML